MWERQRGVGLRPGKGRCNYPTSFSGLDSPVQLHLRHLPAKIQIDPAGQQRIALGQVTNVPLS